MDSMAIPAWATQGMPRATPGRDVQQDSIWDVRTPRAPVDAQPTASGARTPDFLTVHGWPAGDDAQHADGADTPRNGTEDAKAIMDQLCSKLRSLETKTKGSVVALPAQDDAMMVPMPYALFSRGARPAPLPMFAGAPCRPPPGLPAPEPHYAQVPPPPEPVVPRGATKTPPKFVVSYGSVGHPLECGAMCERENCDLGARCPDCHICRVEETEKARQVAEAQNAEEHCPSVGSIGHPHTCAEACKFYPKARGCKDGALCTRCHLCRWNRYQHKSGPTEHSRGQRFGGFFDRSG